MSPGRETVRAAVLVAPRRIEVERLPRPSVDADAALVAVELCGICGTDLKTFAGDLPAPYPIVLGHEIVGRVAEIGERAARRYGVAAGDRVLVESSIPCWSCPACRSGAYRLCPTKGGYGTRLSVSVPPGLWGGLAELLYLAPGSIVHRLPASIGPRVAIAIPLVANGLQWVTRMGSLRPGDRVLVQGCGPQGLAAALVARAGGAAEVTVTGLTTDRGRLAFA
ncbi:MAG TPA: alcohol dehydrogenase catalytic domain-containing protein, partial [Candidatus Limnocylindrales bacterium]|nr:alcohol dehydrogenase catalytic domain-containing protein [Candidatus Limnocylindrales bacterium]